MVNRFRRLLRRRKTPRRSSDHRKKDILEKDIGSTSGSSSHSCVSCLQAFKSRAYDNYATPVYLDMSCRSGTATGTSGGSRAAMEMTMAKSAKPQKSTLRPKKDRYRLDLDASTTTASTHQSGSHADGSVLLCPSYASNDVECRLFATELSSITSTRATPTRDNRYHQQVTFEEVPQSSDHPVQIPVYATYSPVCVRPVAMMGQYTDDDTPYNSHSRRNYSKQPEWKSEWKPERRARSERKRDASVILSARRQALMAQAKFYGADHSDTLFARQQLCNEMASGRLSESVLNSEVQPTDRSRRANSIVSRSA